jgi:hypothetical protein
VSVEVDRSTTADASVDVPVLAVDPDILTEAGQASRPDVDAAAVLAPAGVADAAPAEEADVDLLAGPSLSVLPEVLA